MRALTHLRRIAGYWPCHYPPITSGTGTKAGKCAEMSLI